MLDAKLIVEKTDFVKEALLKRMGPEELDLDEIISLHNELKKKKRDF